MTFAFVTVLRSGGVYTPQWVDRLCRDAREHLQPDRVACLTDKLHEAAHDLAFLNGLHTGDWIVPLLHNWPGYFSKLELFRPGLFSGPVVYMDLDSLLLAPIDFAPVFERLEQGPEKLAMLSDFYQPKIAASGVMAWIPSRETEAIYHEFAVNPEFSGHWAKGDGYHIGRHPHVRLQSLLPGVFGSYKAHRLQNISRDFAHVSFHGTPKFNDLPPSHWMRQKWEHS